MTSFPNRADRNPRRAPRAAALLALLAAPVATAPVAAQAGALFPEPFVVEHHLVQTDGDGGRFETEAVTDYYGGSWIVSVRPDGSRVVVDLARREVTEVRSDRGTYWTASFDRLADLAERAARADRRARPAAKEADPGAATGAATKAAAELVVQELPRPAPDAIGLRRGTPNAGRPATGIQRLRVVESSRADDPEAGVEVWLDPTIRLRPAALRALAAFEATLDGSRDGDEPTAPVARYLAAAREHAGGAMPVRTVRTLATGPATARVRLEDVASRLEPVADFPEELAAVPEGLRRVPHPLEAVVAFLEAEAERDRAMSGAARNRR
jgi:hypothetical protein